MSKHVAENAWDIIDNLLAKGSSKDGTHEAWRELPKMYHLSKAQSHLATHIKQLHDPRTMDGENHLHLALTRIAMVLAQD